MYNFFLDKIVNTWKQATSILCVKVKWNSELDLPKLGPFSYTTQHTLTQTEIENLRGLFQEENWELINLKRQAPMIEYVVQLELVESNDTAPLFFYDSRGQFFGYIQDEELIAVDLSEQGNLLLQTHLIAGLDSVEQNEPSKGEQ